MDESKVRTALITGGAGFIGSNLAERLLSDSRTRVKIFDNFSRKGVSHNLRWLRSLPGASSLEVVEGDVRNARALEQAARTATEIYHLAAQVAVTTSVKDPAHDFEVNAQGTFNMLEAARRAERKPFLLFTSTNKVYGALHQVSVEINAQRYQAVDPDFCGVDETQPLDFHSPYGCSKGAADQYVRDYARIYDLPTVVFRMSCIAGPRQFGNEDQGWVAHFLYSVLAGKPITIYGDGRQVRDVLHVYDLLDAMMAAREQIDRCRGEVFNVGGGITQAVSVLELLDEIERRTGMVRRCHFREVRPGDQPLYISDTQKLERLTGWRARQPLSETLENIHEFWRQNQQRIAGIGSLRTETTAEDVAMEVA